MPGTRFGAYGQSDRRADYHYRSSAIKPVVVETGADVGMNASILPGARIGAHAIVGAGAVVTGDIPPYAIAAGVPARYSIAACGKIVRWEEAVGMSRIRIGVVGCGYWGQNLIRNFSDIPDVDVAAVCDFNLNALARVKRRYRIDSNSGRTISRSWLTGAYRRW